MSEKVEIPRHQYEVLRSEKGSKEAEKFIPVDDSEPEEQSDSMNETDEGDVTEDDVQEESFEEIMAEDSKPEQPEPEAEQEQEQEVSGEGSDEGAVKSVLDSLGVDWKKEGDNILFKGKVDGEEVWAPLPDAMRKYQSDAAINKRFQEAAEKKKQAEKALEEARAAKEEEDQIQKFLDEYSPDNQKDEFDLLGESDSDIPDKVLKRLEYLEKKIAKEEKQKEKQQEMEKVNSERRKKMEKAFRTVDAFIDEAGLYAPTKEESAKVGQYISSSILSETGERNEEFWNRISDPTEVLSLYKRACNEMALGEESSGTDEGDEPPVPPVRPDKPPEGHASKVERLKRRRDTLVKEYDRVTSDKRGEVGIELNKINTKLKELT